MQELVAFMREKGFIFEPILDGHFHRFERNAPPGKANAWFVGREIRAGGKAWVRAKFGDWRTDELFDFETQVGGQGEISPEERAAYEEAAQKLWLEAKKAREQAWEETASACQDLWDNRCSDRGESPYFKRKGLTGIYGCRLYPTDDSGLLTVVPARDVAGKLWGLQFIHENGTKKFKRSMKIHGCFHTIPGQGEEFYLSEGIATAASIHEATHQVTISAFNAGNLMAVAEALRHKNLIACGDDDVFTPGNPGRAHAENLAKTLQIPCFFPVFKDLAMRPTDFNDLHALEGLEAVKACLTPRPGDAGEKAKIVTGPWGAKKALLWDTLQPLTPRTNAQGKTLPPTQQRVVDHLLEHFRGRLIKQDRDLFKYTGKFWQILSTHDLDRIRMAIAEVTQGMADVRFIDAAYKLLVYALPSVPPEVDLFQPRPNCANFTNGTLHYVKRPGDKGELIFKEHSPDDYLVNLLPYEYRPGDGERNREFEQMLERVFEGDSDKTDKIRAVRQMYGACLMPAFPHLFMLWGRPGTGKSTILKIAGRLVHKDNLCHVAPSDFGGFHMETMAGKLVNLNTDIPFDKPIRDDITKKVGDRDTVRIRRKGVKDINAPLPAIHLFGGNDIPRALDGVSGAHDRRWTFLQFEKFVPKGQYDKEYWDYCYDQSPQGILNFALDGLRDLIESGGHFIVPESGRQKITDWQLESNPVGQFLRDVEEGEVLDNNTQLIMHPEAQIERAKLWEIFRAWYKDVFNVCPLLPRHRVYKTLLESRRVAEKKIRGVRYFSGVGSRVTEGADF